MSVQFNEDRNPFESVKYSSTPKGITGFLIKKGLVKNKSQASILMLVISIASLTATFFILRDPVPQQAQVTSDDTTQLLEEEGAYDY